MVDTQATVHLEDYLKSIMTDATLLQWKKNFNKIADKASKAGVYMNADNVGCTDKDLLFLYYRLEVLEPFTRYMEVFTKLGIPLPEDPFQGYPEAR